LRIVPGVWPATEALLAASDLQVLPPDRFQVIEIPWSSAVIRAFGSGAADVAVVTLDGVLRMQEAGQKLKVIMVLSPMRLKGSVRHFNRRQNCITSCGRGPAQHLP